MPASYALGPEQRSPPLATALKDGLLPRREGGPALGGPVLLGGSGRLHRCGEEEPGAVGAGTHKLGAVLKGMQVGLL